MIKSAVYQGNSFLGEAEIYLKNPTSNAAWTKEIRISHLSPPSTRCPPLAVLHTIATDGICLRMESRATTTSATQQTEEPSPISLLHAACLRENKTAVVSLGDVELHLVALLTRKFEKHACFWGFTVPPGLYVSCLVMLNLRCLGIVFDLDETLIVANTLRSFEDRIDALQRKINTEMDQQRVAGMLAEVKRYQDDKSVLKQYAETDQVVDNGKIFRVQSELVPPMSEIQQSMIRPVIRLPERNIILTRINPGIRDTSVLVRLRPAWEDFRSYLTAKGRKRFEVYVCTMAERDYALEMWRLLDPDLNLINSNQLLERIVCVKSGMRKSLLNVFQGGVCHPKMALVIDDRLKVWDEKDQPRVHVVPAFAPYYAPQAETNSAVPVLCVARNVACNVRGSFFKDFDEAMLPRFSDTFYEDDISIIPSAPDAGNYLLSEDDPSFPNGNKDQIFFDGMADAEVERRLKDANGAPAVPPMVGNLDPRLLFCPPHVLSTSSSMVSVTAPLEILPLHNSQYPPLVAPAKQLVQPGLPDSSIQSSAREEGEVPESELDPDTRRRLLIAQHGQDTRDHAPADPPFPVRPLPAPVPPVQSSGSWLHIDREMSPREIDTVPKDFRMDLEPLRFDKKRQPYFQGMEKSSYPDRGFHEKQRYSKKAYRGYDRLRGNQSTATYEPYRADEMPIAYPSSNTRDAINAQTESRRSGSALHSENPETPTSVLEGIASKCGAKVQFRTALADTVELQFSVQVWFNGDKIGEAVGKTRKDAQNLAADHSLRTLANKYISNAMPESSATSGDMDTILPGKEIGCGETNFFGVQMQTKNDASLDLSTSDKSRAFDAKLDGTKASSVSLTALKEYCTLEGLDLLFEDCPPVSSDAVKKMEFHAQVKIDGQLYGKGAGMSWDEAKFQAAEEALVILKSSIRQFTNQHIGSTRHQQAVSNKGLSFDFPRSLDRLPSSRYQKSGPLVP